MSLEKATPAEPLTDILSYILPDEAWAQEHHLAVAGGGQPIYCLLRDNAIWEMKGSAGMPWDSFSVDENYIYQSITENDKAAWNSPDYNRSFKMFASKSWPGSNGGIAWLPRYFNAGGFNAPLVTADSSYRYYLACVAQPVTSLNAPVMTTVDGPYSKDFGGDLKVQDAIVQRYFWGPGYVNMEVNYYPKGFGRAQWEKWMLANGIYVLAQTSAFNTILPGGVPKLSFPCGVPVVV